MFKSFHISSSTFEGHQRLTSHKINFVESRMDIPLGHGILKDTNKPNII